MDKYYSIEEVSKMLKVVYLTVYRWIQSGKLKSAKAGRQYRIKSNDLELFLNSYKNNKKI